MLIAGNLANRYNFYAYSFKDEMISDGILRAVEAFKSFDKNRDNPFTYFTVVIFRSFIGRIKIEKKKRKTLDHLIMVDEIYSLQEGDDSFSKDQVIGDLQFESWFSDD